MPSILNIMTPATNRDLTTLARVKLELNINAGSSDEILEAKIGEASSDIEAYLGYGVARETVTETVWDGSGVDHFLTRRSPIVSISSIMLDDDTVASALYRYDAAAGVIFSLNESGYPYSWIYTRSATIVYVTGYVLPGESNRDLPEAIEGACIDLVQDYWFAKGRDGLVKSEDIPGVRSVDYWVGAVGAAGDLPPRVVAKLRPFRRARL